MFFLLLRDYAGGAYRGEIAGTVIGHRSGRRMIDGSAMSARRAVWENWKN